MEKDNDVATGGKRLFVYIHPHRKFRKDYPLHSFHEWWVVNMTRGQLDGLLASEFAHRAILREATMEEVLEAEAKGGKQLSRTASDAS